jgi:CHASE3 domain sensor protein
MTSEWPQVDELIRELSEVSALPNADAEPSLTDATMAVTKATTALARAAQARGRNSAAALAQALATVDEARALLRQARAAMNAAARQRRDRVAETSTRPVSGEGQVEATCPVCRAPFVVRYRLVTAGPLVAFPVACPAADCDGVSEVQYPGSARDVVVEMLPGA